MNHPLNAREKAIKFTFNFEIDIFIEKLCSYMEKQERIRKIINWLIFSSLVEGQNDLAHRLGYSSSYMSQALSGAKVISESLISRICSLDENLSVEWALDGTGSMFKNNPFSSNEEPVAPSSVGEVTVDASVWEVIKNQAASLASRDKQIDELISMLREEISENKKMAAQRGDVAGCAGVG